MPSPAQWKKAAKRWRKTARRERERYYRTQDALREVGVSVMLASRVFDGEKGDRTIVFTKSTEKVG